MSLDQNLFTLAIAGSTEEPGALDLTDPNSGTIYYRRRMNPPTPENGYSWGFYDPLSGSLLCTVTAANSAAKQKWIELHNPDAKVELTFTGSFSFKWSFLWEDHTFEWKRESCYLNRKPDPPVQVAVTREPAGRIRTSQVQLLDYNLNRFDINDRKGLEIVMLAALLSFRDQAEDLRSGDASPVSVAPSRHNSDGPPALPAKSAAEVVSALQSINKVQQNVVIVGDQGVAEDYAKHCVDMLKDDSMLYIVLRPQSAEHVAKVIGVAEATKRFYYKSGRHNEDLHQYVTMEDAQPSNAGPKVINLDDHGKKKKEYVPPQTVTVHLSKIPMPELQPKAKPPSPKAAHATPTPSSSSANNNNKPAKSSGRTGRDQSPARPPAGSSNPSSSSSNKLSKPSQQQQQQQRPGRDPSPNPYRYQMGLYPPTGAPPSFSDQNNNNPQKQHKHKKDDSKDDRKRRQQQEQQQQQQQPQQRPYSMMPTPNAYQNNTQMPGSWPNTPGSSSGGGGGAMNANANYRPPSAPQPNGMYPGFNSASNYGGSSTPGRYTGGPPTGPPPGTYPGQPQQQQSSQQSNPLGLLTNAGMHLFDKLAHKNPNPTSGR